MGLLLLVGCSSDEAGEAPTAVPSEETAVQAEVEPTATNAPIEPAATAVPEEPAVEPTAVVKEEPVAETAVPEPTPVPALRPLVPDTDISDPASSLGEYMEEGHFISHFDSDDIGGWQGYSQDTEVVLHHGQDPPEGYITTAYWHAKQVNYWVQPTDGFLLQSDKTIFGDGAGHWDDTVESTRLVTNEFPTDWSDYTFISFWAYSEVANDAGIEFVLYSETDRTPGDDHYKREIIIDWTGWRLFEIPLHEFSSVREPVGFHKIDYIKIASSAWGHQPDETTELIFDEMKLSNIRVGPKLAIDLPTEREHPYLMLNQDEIEQIKDKIENHHWAKLAYITLQVRVDRWLELNRKLEVPDVGGGFYHAEDTAAYDITEDHYGFADKARDMALLYHLSGDATYMEKSKAILLSYADKYLSYEIHDKAGRVGDEASAGGRATAQAINEARWIVPLAWAYDLIFNDMTEAERTAVADNLLRPAAELIMLNNEGRHNHQTWYNTGVGVVGFVLNEKEYIWYALLKDDSSMAYQLDKSVTGDGMWYEGSMHYQFYVLRAFWPLMEATHHAGFNVYENPKYKALFDFMVTYADPDLQMPNLGDGRVVNLADRDRVTYYELAYARFGDPRYLPILETSYRNDLNALLYGAAEFGEPETPAWETQIYEKSDLVVLRAGEGEEQLQATVNYMGYQGGHSHADQLSMVLYGLGQPLAPDPGSIRYRIPAQEGWFKQTLSHNALVVDGLSQERAVPGQLTQFVAGEQLQMATVTHDTLYPGVDLARTLLLNEDYVIDIYRAESEEPHVYDWVYHNLGKFSSEDLPFLPVAEPLIHPNPEPPEQPSVRPLGFMGGYDYLRDVQTAVSPDNWEADWINGGVQNMRLHLLGAPETTYYTANGLIATTVGDEIAENRVPLLISRREITGTQFVSILQPYRYEEELAEITAVSLTDELGQPIPAETTQALQLERETSTDLFVFGTEDGIKQVDSIQFNGSWGLFSQHEGELRWLLTTGHETIGDGWAVYQQDLSSEKTPEGLSVYVEVAESGNLFVVNLFEFVSYIKFEGFMDAAVQIIEYDHKGNVIREMPFRKNGDGIVEFLAHPGVSYEIVNE
ncbi:MAG: heparinase II/III family protein [Chloroflexota bacterium]